MTTAIERLETLLDERDAEIAKLEAEQETREYDDRWGWMKQTVSDEAEGLPIPRLEIRWRKLDDWSWLAEYCLVRRFFLGEVLRQPFSVTRQSGGRSTGPVTDGVVDTPFRDGAHMRHDMRHLNLPGFAVCEGTVTTIEPMTQANPYAKALPKAGART